MIATVNWRPLLHGMHTGGMILRRKVAIAILVATCAVWTGWRFGFQSQSWRPVDVPLAVAEGSQTTAGPFKVSVSGAYDIDVEATAAPKLPLDDLMCALGLHGFSGHKQCGRSAPLRISWTVSDGTVPIAAGSSDADEGGWVAEGWSQAGRTIGGFNARKGQMLRVKVVSISGANSLSGANPRVTVKAGGAAYENALVITGLLNVVCFFLGVTGFLLLAIPARRTKNEQPRDWHR